MLRANRIKDYTFSLGSLTASAGGLFDVYSDHTINGTIQTITIGSNSYTNTGSILVYVSGTDNSVQNDLIIRARAGSMMQTIAPYRLLSDNQSVAGSFTNVLLDTQFVANAPIRVVGSAVGNATSGLYITVRYI